ncbi:MAG: HAD family hydrolase [Candidatus Micrarchaeia archaeon]
MIKLVVFDIDGTLVDSDAALARAFQNTFSAFGLKSPSMQQVIKFAGNAEKKWLELIVAETSQHATPQKISEMSEYFRKKYYSFYFPVMAHLKAGVKEALNQIRGLGVKTAIITNGKRAYVERVTSFFKIAELFDETISVDEVSHTKPSPEPLTRVLHDLRVKPSEALYVGDTEIDAETARGAGVKFVLVVNSRNKKVKADYRISSFSELPSLAGRQPDN